MIWIWYGENKGRCFFLRKERLYFFREAPKGRNHVMEQSGDFDNNKLWIEGGS